MHPTYVGIANGIEECILVDIYDLFQDQTLDASVWTLAAGILGPPGMPGKAGTPCELKWP